MISKTDTALKETANTLSTTADLAARGSSLCDCFRPERDGGRMGRLADLRCQVPPHLGQQRKGDYIVTAFFQMSDPLGTPGAISNNVLVAQPTVAFGKG